MCHHGVTMQTQIVQQATVHFIVPLVGLQHHPLSTTLLSAVLSVSSEFYAAVSGLCFCILSTVLESRVEELSFVKCMTTTINILI